MMDTNNNDNIIKKGNFRIVTLNVNGMCTVRKQEMLVDFLQKENIQCCLIQGHNLKCQSSVSDIVSDKYDIFFNASVKLKGGTMILIDRKIKYSVLSCENSHDSRIISLKIFIETQQMHLLNVYAPSGKNHHLEREELFRNEILYYLRNSLSTTIWGGDFNCIIRKTDVSNKNDDLISKALDTTIKQLKLSDAWFLKHDKPKFTYFRQNYGSRLDRFYIGDLRDSIKDIEVNNVSFSDHAAVVMSLDIDKLGKRGRYYWKLNTILLELDEIKEDFSLYWQQLKRLIYSYPNISDWWEYCVKPNIKKFFIKQGKHVNQLKLGKIKYLECRLKSLYTAFQTGGVLHMNEVKSLMQKINEEKYEILEGVKVRARIQEYTQGEKPSAFLIGKQIKTKKYSLITKLIPENNLPEYENITEITDKDGIENYVSNFYEETFKESRTTEHDKGWFLSLIEKVINDSDNLNLTEDITIDELHTIIKNMEPNKSPGIDGIPVEFYQTYWDIIKLELFELVQYLLSVNTLSETQRKAVIVLIEKGDDLTFLSSWRPISLLCVDTKIIAKCIASRLKNVIEKCISKNQFCSPAKSIIECNNIMRDTLYYANTNNIQGAIINVDWCRAFDSIDHDLLFKIMEKNGVL